MTSENNKILPFVSIFSLFRIEKETLSLNSRLLGLRTAALTAAKEPLMAASSRVGAR